MKPANVLKHHKKHKEDLNIESDRAELLSHGIVDLITSEADLERHFRKFYSKTPRPQK